MFLAGDGPRPAPRARLRARSPSLPSPPRGEGRGGPRARVPPFPACGRLAGPRLVGPGGTRVRRACGSPASRGGDACPRRAARGTPRCPPAVARSSPFPGRGDPAARSAGLLTPRVRGGRGVPARPRLRLTRRSAGPCSPCVRPRAPARGRASSDRPVASSSPPPGGGSASRRPRFPPGPRAVRRSVPRLSSPPPASRRRFLSLSLPSLGSPGSAFRSATSDQTWRPAEFKHISQRRKRN